MIYLDEGYVFKPGLFESECLASTTSAHLDGGEALFGLSHHEISLPMARHLFSMSSKMLNSYAAPQDVVMTTLLSLS